MTLLDGDTGLQNVSCAGMDMIEKLKSHPSQKREGQDTRRQTR
jgi:hypothetical protein